MHEWIWSGANWYTATLGYNAFAYTWADERSRGPRDKGHTYAQADNTRQPAWPHGRHTNSSTHRRCHAETGNTKQHDRRFISPWLLATSPRFSVRHPLASRQSRLRGALVSAHLIEFVWIVREVAIDHLNFSKLKLIKLFEVNYVTRKA